MKKIVDIDTISQIHRTFELPSPDHPLISVISTKDFQKKLNLFEYKYRINLYLVSLKTVCSGSLRYGRNSYDFQEGTLVFTAPGQVLSLEEGEIENFKNDVGWTIIFHPDFIRNSPLATSISDYSFFDYEIYEALHVSDKEKKLLLDFVNNIKTEITHNIDKHSQELITINLESILKYSQRYYERQFFTRSNLNKDFMAKFEKYLKGYFASPQLINNGLPNIEQCGNALNMSGHYLSDLLKAETGKSAKEHIHLYMIEQAKNKLLGSTASVSEIAFEMGFEYPQHFSKLFKSKTGLSPSEYRNVN